MKILNPVYFKIVKILLMIRWFKASIVTLAHHKFSQWAGYSKWLPRRGFHDIILLSQDFRKLWSDNYTKITFAIQKRVGKANWLRWNMGSSEADPCVNFSAATSPRPRPWSVVIVLFTEAGNHHWCHWSTSPHLIPRGRPIASSCTLVLYACSPVSFLVLCLS